MDKVTEDTAHVGDVFTVGTAVIQAQVGEKGLGRATVELVHVLVAVDSKMTETQGRLTGFLTKAVTIPRPSRSGHARAPGVEPVDGSGQLH